MSARRIAHFQFYTKYTVILDLCHCLIAYMLQFYIHIALHVVLQICRVTCSVTDL